MDNAGHAIAEGEGPGCVLVTAERLDGAPVVVLRVRDDGVGIEPRRIASVFDAFETSRAAGALFATRAAPSGSGGGACSGEDAAADSTTIGLGPAFPARP